MSDDPWGDNHTKMSRELEINDDILCRIELLKSLQETFMCERCGECCRQESIAFTERDVQRASEKKNISPHEFIERYGLTLADHSVELVYYRLFTGTGEICPFNHDRDCTIYDARPQVCRGFPFLTPENVENAFHLNNEISLCGKCKAAISQAEKIFSVISIRTD
ncbi:MAG TPA: YkgJ family cysteine cluster protein [Methanomassiliicoccales archaeon]|jgi:Fe-S-cluster containining protein